MPVTIDPNIKKQRIFIDKHGNKITEDQMLGGGMGNNMGGNPRTEGSKPGERG